MKLVGATSEDISTFISLNAIAEKSKDAIQLFVLVIIPALRYDVRLHPATQHNIFSLSLSVLTSPPPFPSFSVLGS